MHVIFDAYHKMFLSPYQCQWHWNLELMEYVGKVHIPDDHVLTITVELTQTCLNKMYSRFQFHLTIM